jgi:hypothetical protein
MKKFGFGLLGALMLVSATAAADGPKYGTAGCGLGSIVIGNTPGFVQVFAVTFNGTFANQLFAISSGTSNCDSGSGGAKSAKVFIETNREALAKDIARGNGETISSLSQLAGCSDATAVGASLQRNFKTIFPQSSMSDSQVSENVMSSLRTDKALGCSI